MYSVSISDVTVSSVVNVFIQSKKFQLKKYVESVA